MGREAVCTVRIEGQASEGKVLLETREIIFRGAPRLRIPLSDITSVEADDGTLRVAFAGRVAEFELGAKEALKWVDSILHPPSLLNKLGIKPGLRYRLHGSLPAEIVAVTEPLTRADGDTVDMVFFGADLTSELAAIPQILPQLSGNGALWVVYPRGQKTIREMDVLNAGRAAGLVDIKVAAVSDIHTGLMFVRPKGGR